MSERAGWRTSTALDCFHRNLDLDFFANIAEILMKILSRFFLWNEKMKFNDIFLPQKWAKMHFGMVESQKRSQGMPSVPHGPWIFCSAPLRQWRGLNQWPIFTEISTRFFIVNLTEILVRSLRALWRSLAPILMCVIVVAKLMRFEFAAEKLWRCFDRGGYMTSKVSL